MPGPAVVMVVVVLVVAAEAFATASGKGRRRRQSGDDDFGAAFALVEPLLLGTDARRDGDGAWQRSSARASGEAAARGAAAPRLDEDDDAAVDPAKSEQDDARIFDSFLASEALSASSSFYGISTARRELRAKRNVKDVTGPLFFRFEREREKLWCREEREKTERESEFFFFFFLLPFDTQQLHSLFFLLHLRPLFVHQAIMVRASLSLFIRDLMLLRPRAAFARRWDFSRRGAQRREREARRRKEEEEADRR